MKMSNLEINNSPTKISTNNKRLSKLPIAIVVIIVILVLFSILYAVIARKQANNNQPTTQSQTQSTQQTQDINSHINALAQKRSTKVETNATTTQSQNPTQIQNTPVLVQPTISQEISKKEELKKDLYFKALSSASQLNLKNQKNKNSQTKAPANYINPNQALLEQQNAEIQGYLSSIQGMTGGQSSDLMDKDSKAEAFLKKQKDSGYLENIKKKSLSAYEIKAGWNIPAILITGVNSELPGQILAQISQNVYDTATGRYLLIPQGTKAIGSYSSNIIYGQSRLLVAWHKLIFPNGDTLDIENMQGVSQDGYTGFKDQVNNHYLRIFGSALLLSAITAGISLADTSNDMAQRETPADKAIAQAIEQMGNVASEMIRKNMNISPTLEIRPGYKFNIFVTKDMILEPLRLDR